MTLAEITAFLNALAALAWPTFLLCFVFYFRKEIGEVFRRVRRGKLLGQEIELSPGSDAPRIHGPTVSLHEKESARADGLTELQMKILEKFLEKGDHDSLKYIEESLPWLCDTKKFWVASLEYRKARQGLRNCCRVWVNGCRKKEIRNVKAYLR